MLVAVAAAAGDLLNLQVCDRQELLRFFYAQMIEIAHGRSTGGGLEQVGQMVRADAAKHSHGSDGPGFHVGLVQMENQTVDGKVGVCRVEIVIPGTFDQNQKPEKITVDQFGKIQIF